MCKSCTPPLQRPQEAALRRSGVAAWGGHTAALWAASHHLCPVCKGRCINDRQG
jgi:hypothetical protein